MTLVESVIAVLIVSVVLVMALASFGSVARGRRVASDSDVSTTLGRGLISEVLQCAYTEPVEAERFGPEISERGDDRENFDDVDDYDQWSASPPQDKDGSVMSHLDGWRRSVSVVNVRPDNLEETGTDTGLKLITVTVTSPRSAQSSFTALRSSSGVCDRGESEDTYVGWVGVEIQLGADDKTRVTCGTNILNDISAGGLGDE